MASISSLSNEALENLYKQYLEDPESVEESLRSFFQGFDIGYKNFKGYSGKFTTEKEFKVKELIDEYRKRGHLFTKTNPVRVRRKYTPDLDIKNFGLSPSDINEFFDAGSDIGIGRAKLKGIIDHLDETYCSSIGAEYMFIRNREIESWLKHRLESKRNRPLYSDKVRGIILDKLREAVYFEKFIHKKYPGQKRFSLEGAESLIPALDAVIELGADMGAKEFIIGMAHRGRLNVLANILKKPIKTILSEFGGHEYEDIFLLGDVKYHLGYTTCRQTSDGKDIRVTIAPNPSHLEAVFPVVQGVAKARMERNYKSNTRNIIPVIIHGDASIAGQGVVYEVVQMSELPAYSNGGTIHLVINNQIGFTTNYLDGRSSVYCTDIAKVIQSPVFHVNGDDVEAVAYTMRMAMEFREKFKKDVFVDILCYRKYGHNESDEPRFTQPVLYKIIEKHPDPYTIYKKRLLDQNIFDIDKIENDEKALLSMMESEHDTAKEISKVSIRSFLASTWEKYRKAKPEDFHNSPVTAVSDDMFKMVAERISALPEKKRFFRKIISIQKERRDMVFGSGMLDWAMAEMMAYGTLLAEKYNVRISGQDVERGTFSHRHAVLSVEESDKKYIPLDNISKEQGNFNIYNSLLSEYGVLGFEYGYALAAPDTLTVWEAQFGDFANGGQIIIDQFLSGAEEKWNVMNGLTLLLPHGYEGQGPEHSSARMERFLNLCAEINMQVANCSTPANFFHLLRRQLKRDFRKPLVIFTPKSLLRHPDCLSKVEEFTNGGFKEIIDDHNADPLLIKKVVLCTGKIWYQLKKEQEKKNSKNVAIVRLEQLYPLPLLQLREIVQKYDKAATWLWTQEEPGNMGAWSYISRNFRDVNLTMVARPDSGSPATGSPKFHKIRQEKIIEKTFGKCECNRVKEECRMICAEKDH